MYYRVAHMCSWSAGLIGLAIVIWYFQPANFVSSLRAVGIGGLFGWLVLTISARFLLVETTVLPLRYLGFSLGRADAFWIGWIRTFANQVLPLSGLAVYAHEVRRKTGIPWSGILALSTPQFLLATFALSLVCMFALVSNFDYLDAAAVSALLTTALIGTGAILIATHIGWVIAKLPIAGVLFAQQSAESFNRISASRQLIAKIVILHSLAILIRGGRVWLLFLVVGVDINWSHALLMIVIAESAALIQLTPGGMGLREGAIIGSAILLGVSPDVGAIVALIDRLFIIGTTTVLAVPGLFIIRQNTAEKTKPD